MKPAKLTRLFIFLLAPIALQAQSISGVVNDPSGKGASFASIGLYMAKDSSLVKGARNHKSGSEEETSRIKE